jgi:transposase
VRSACRHYSGGGTSAGQLAVLYRAGALTAIHVPTDQEEAVRDLLRGREDIRADLLRARHRLSKFLLRHGRRFTATIQELMTLEPLRPRIQRLRCFRGMDDITALTIAAELGDARRFPSARGLMAYVGLIPSEHSSGTTRARGAITKTGNAHLRRVLVEAAWHYRDHPFIGKQLRHRQEAASESARLHAWRAPQRLYRRYQRLAARGKPKQHVVTAIARELTGFVWETLTQ